MARSRPAQLRADELPDIAEPCHQPWEQMPGSARIRHCAACDRDVHNLAALSTAEARALLSRPGPLPCLRITRHADGTPVTTEPTPHPGPAPVWIAASALLASASGFLARAQASTQGAPPPALLQPGPVIAGHVLDPEGKAVPQAHLILLTHGRQIASTDSAPDGAYRFAAPSPGTYQLSIHATGAAAAILRTVELTGTHRTEFPIQLTPPPQPLVAAGVPAMPPRPEPTMGKIKVPPPKPEPKPTYLIGRVRPAAPPKPASQP